MLNSQSTFSTGTWFHERSRLNFPNTASIVWSEKYGYIGKNVVTVSNHDLTTRRLLCSKCQEPVPVGPLTDPLNFGQMTEFSEQIPKMFYFTKNLATKLTKPNSQRILPTCLKVVIFSHSLLTYSNSAARYSFPNWIFSNWIQQVNPMDIFEWYIACI